MADKALEDILEVFFDEDEEKALFDDLEEDAPATGAANVAGYSMPIALRKKREDQ